MGVLPPALAVVAPAPNRPVDIGATVAGVSAGAPLRRATGS